MRERKIPEKNPDRCAVLERIREYEARGGEWFFHDVENDPPAPTLMPEDVDYMGKKWTGKLKRLGAVTLRGLFANKILREQFHLTIRGAEYLEGLTGGAVFTSNHFAPFENLCVRAASQLVEGNHRFFCVIREGNYSMPGFLGYLLRNCDTMPLSSSLHTMALFNRAVETRLQEGAHILIYPEQSMWYRYPKPRPYRIGAYHIAAKNRVPVVPCFVTWEEIEGFDKDGFPNLAYTLHIMPPIYPDPDKNTKENAAWMRERNATLTHAKYEEVYGEPLPVEPLS